MSRSWREKNYIEAIAVQYGVGFESLRKMVNQLAMKGYVPKAETDKRQRKTPEKGEGIKKAQRLLLTCLMEYPDLFGTVKQYVTPEDFTEELSRTVAQMLLRTAGTRTGKPC